MAEEASSPYLTCEEALEPIESGRRNGCCSYIWRDRYVYKKNSEYEAATGLVYYMKCWECNCKATMVCRAVTLVPVSSTEHNHPPQKTEVLKLRFKYELIGKLRANPQESSSQLYDKLAVDPRFKDVAQLLGRRRTTSMMSRVKQTLKEYRKIKMLKKTKPRIRTRYIPAIQSKKRAKIQVNKFDMVDNMKNEDDMSEENEEDMLQENEEDVLQENEEDMLQENEEDMLQENEDDMLQESEEYGLEENEENQTTKQQEDSKSNIVSSTKRPSSSNVRVRNDQFNSNNTSNFVTAASEPISSSNKKSDAAELKNVIYKLEEISKRLYAVTLTDTYEQFGKYIGSLLRGLPREKAKKIMENIVSEVLSAKLGFEVRVQPTKGEAVFAESLPECFEYDLTDTYVEKTVVIPFQTEDQTSVSAKTHNESSTNKDQQASNYTPLKTSVSGSESGIAKRSAKPLKNNSNQRIETVCEKSDSYKSPTTRLKKGNASKASPSPRSSVDYKRAFNEDDEHSVETEMTYQEVDTDNLANSSSCAEQVVECSSESLMSYVMAGDDNSLCSTSSEDKNVQFICTCRNMYFNSSHDLRKHFSSKHPGEERLNGRLHIPKFLDPSKNKDCMVCSKQRTGIKGDRKRTRLFCDTCTNKPGLHPGLCFERYHTLKKFRID